MPRLLLPPALAGAFPACPLAGRSLELVTGEGSPCRSPTAPPLAAAQVLPPEPSPAAGLGPAHTRPPSGLGSLEGSESSPLPSPSV